MFFQKPMKTAADLEYLDYPGDQQGDLNFVLMHGYGANAGDLYPLAEYLKTPKVKHWYFPNGPLEAFGVPMGRAWFPIDMAALERAMISGEPRDFSKIPIELVKTRLMITQWLDALGLVPEKTVLGGFSQGAMLATDIVLNTQAQFHGLVILSGTFLGKDEWPNLMEQKAPVPFFQSHGTHDLVLPIDQARKLNQYFATHNWPGEYVEFSGQHEIPPNVLGQLIRFLASL